MTAWVGGGLRVGGVVGLGVRGWGVGPAVGGAWVHLRTVGGAVGPAFQRRTGSLQIFKKRIDYFGFVLDVSLISGNVL